MMKKKRTYFQPKVIRCPHCGGEISINAGHSARMIICNSCKTALDSYKGFAEYERFIGRKMSVLPLKIGMTGKIDNVEFIVTAVVSWLENDEDGCYSSYSFYLFSPTHGFCRIDRDHNFRYSFFRKIRRVPIPTPHQIGDKFSIKFKEKNFKVTESGTEKICQVEGELPWLAKVGDSYNYLLAENEHGEFFETSSFEFEQEYFLGHEISPENVYSAFNITGKPIKAKGLSSAQRYLINFARNTAGILFIPCFIITMFLWLKPPGKNIYNETFSYGSYNNARPTKEFTVRKPNSLMRIDLNYPVNNAWGEFEISVCKGKNQYFTTLKGLSYYSGYEDGFWSEGSQKGRVYFKLPEAGKYHLKIFFTGVSGGSALKEKLHVSIYESVYVIRYFLILTIILCIIGFYTVIYDSLCYLSSD